MGSTGRRIPQQLSQMPTRERDARPGLQVPLEGKGAPLIGEFDHDINGPRAVLASMSAATSVVLNVS